MAGLYIHIPFCRTRCIYCDFCSSTLGDDAQARYADALCNEMDARRDYCHTRRMETLYIGGGTPSLLNDTLLERILCHARRVFDFPVDAEVTVEANPDDINPARMRRWKEVLGINRLSMGVQSFQEAELRWMNRRHTGRQAREAVRSAYEAGLENISIDLIYGLPGSDIHSWSDTLRQALALPVCHLSAYCLSVEPRTPLGKMCATKKTVLPDEEVSEAQYRLLVEATSKAGFVHYEISNFARPTYHARHNAAYWDGTPYLGLGAGAHSFDGHTRRANTDNVQTYINADGHPPFTTETLSDSERANETVFTALRTAKGLDLRRFRKQFGDDALRYILQQAARHLATHRLVREGDTLRLSKEGVFVSDSIVADLMDVD